MNLKSSEQINLLEIETADLHNLIIEVANDLVSRNLGDEVVILSIKSGEYLGLDEVGATIWSLIKKSSSIFDIREAVLTKYEVTVEQCERDLLTLLQKLSAKGLVKVRSETGA